MAFFTSAGLQRLQGFEAGPQGAATPPYNASHPGSNSTASGLYGFTDTTWRDFAPRAGVDLSQYPSAYLAPASVQTSVAAITPTSHWTCPGCDPGITNAIANDPSLITDQPQNESIPTGGVAVSDITIAGDPTANVDPNANDPFSMAPLPGSPMDSANTAISGAVSGAQSFGGKLAAAATTIPDAIVKAGNAVTGGVNAVGDMLGKNVSSAIASAENYGLRALVMILAMVLLIVAGFMLIPNSTKVAAAKAIAR